MDRPKIGVALLREGEGALFGKARGLFGRGRQRALWVWRRRASGEGNPSPPQGVQYEQADGQQPAGAWGQPAASSQQPAAALLC